jgi:SpoVK/Ycf46/Vps4 family AAA+-type ATPase
MRPVTRTNWSWLKRYRVWEANRKVFLYPDNWLEPRRTGKTMAFGVLAAKLGRDLYRVDLRRVVSKYIGETEKHLDAIFRDAQRAGAVLLMDEADALLGKRSTVKNSHDRYANVETAYLLKRIRKYRGLVVLTTSQRARRKSR